MSLGLRIWPLFGPNYLDTDGPGWKETVQDGVNSVSDFAVEVVQGHDPRGLTKSV